MVQFTPYEIQLCLYDKERTKYFSAALKRLVKPGSIVVDAGSGTGIMGLLAAKYGASKVYCIEIDERFCKVIKENARRNNLSGKITVIKGDATKVKLPEKVDIIVAEIISGGFFFEPQIQVINHLKNFLKEGGKVIPERIDTYMELINAQQDLYGLKFNYDSRYVALNDKNGTNKEIAFTADFTTYISPKINAGAILKSRVNGSVNAIRISYKIKLAGGLWIDKATKFLLNPEIIYFKKPITLKRGKGYATEIKYTASADTLEAKIKVDGKRVL